MPDPLGKAICTGVLFLCFFKNSDHNGTQTQKEKLVCMCSYYSSNLIKTSALDQIFRVNTHTFFGALVFKLHGFMDYMDSFSSHIW
uniref:Uncharacterized protein n=1 Tax=Pyxicephalus adspersus TaxID=30357 RepID=A0AAV3AHS2_PYXAD|nr:TPA: hypothetical protein GDO54_009107 [Pyxicephalus adspersus]